MAKTHAEVRVNSQTRADTDSKLLSRFKSKLVLLASLGAVFVALMLLAGCCGYFTTASVSSSPNQTTVLEENGNGQQAVANTSGNTGSGHGTGTTQGQGNGQQTGDHIIIDAQPGPGGDTSQTGSSGSQQTANSQADCATMTPSCSSCIMKSGCGWCKSKNACFYGSESGPYGDNTCPDDDWTVTEAGCSGPTGGNACETQANCASCLSGSGCKWCIQGSECVGAGSDATCFGGWLTNSYQCNYASR